MTINLTFNDFDEMTAFAEKLVGGSDKVVSTVIEIKKEEIKEKIEDIKKEKVTPSADESPAENITEDVSEDESQTEDQDNSNAKEYELTEVRAKFVELTKKGKQKEAKKILESFGVARVSELEVKDYAAAMEKAGEI